jgi:hypothetical protein
MGQREESVSGDFRVVRDLHKDEGQKGVERMVLP